MNAFIVIVLPLLTIVQSVPLKHHRVETNPELTAGYFEGDMVLNEERLVFIHPAYKWPNNTVYYKISEVFDVEHQYEILKAMQSIELVSCIRFQDATDTNIPYYVNITGNPEGCSSSIGWMNRVQQLNLEIFPLDNGCFQRGTILHELLHTLGFFHTHSDPDRDNYVSIVKDNIMAGQMHNFDKFGKDVVHNFGEEYDFLSVMHYDQYAFSKNGKKTIVPLKNTTAPSFIGQRYFMSVGDIIQLSALYKCQN